MEITFKSPGRSPNLLKLNDVIAHDPWETFSILLLAIRDVTLATYLDGKTHRSYLREEDHLFASSYLQALHIQESLFCPALHTLDFDFIPTQKEAKIIQDAYYGCYKNDDMEGVFYEQGGLYGILALAVVFRKTDSIISKWSTIENKSAQDWLAKNMSLLFQKKGNRWINNFSPTRIYFHTSELDFFGRHKRRRVDSKNKDSNCQQTHSAISIPLILECQSKSPRYTTSPSARSLSRLQYLQEQCHNGLGNLHKRAYQSIPVPGISEENYLRKSCTVYQASSTAANSSPQVVLPPFATLIGPKPAISNIETNAVHASHSRGKGVLYAGDNTTASSFSANISGDQMRTTSFPGFPVADSTEPLLEFQRLDKSYRDLATLLVFLGRANIPIKMLLRAAEPKGFFNREGQIQFAAALDLNPLFAHAQDLESALERLESLQLVKFCKPLSDKPITVQPKLRSLIAITLGDAKRKMEDRASLLVFHSFPIHADAEATSDALFPALYRSQLPHFQHVLEYFDKPNLFNRFSDQQREQIILSCILSSMFGTLDWKWRVLETAETIINTSESLSPLSRKLQLRRVLLKRLHNGYEQQTLWTLESWHETPSEESLLRAQFMIYDDKLSQGWHELENWKSGDSLETDERRLLLQNKTLLQIRICRFAGDFARAKGLLEELKQRGLCKSTVPYYFTDFVSVHCESGEISIASGTIPRGNYAEDSWSNLGPAVRRTIHAAADTRLMQGLWILKTRKRSEFDHAFESLLEAKAIYKNISKVYPDGSQSLCGAIRHFSVAAGLAMIAHVELRFKNTVTELDALSHWQDALKLAMVSGEKLGGTPFPEMIISYTMCDITSRLGLQEKTAQYMSKAKLLYPKTGRQFQYLALGSIWFDLVQEWNTENGLSRITELDYNGYMAQQTIEGFPYVHNSARLSK